MSSSVQILEKPLPSSPESEKIILGAILVDNVVLAEVVEALEPDDFYSPFHRKVFRAMSNLFGRGEIVEPVLIGEELKKTGELEALGGVAAVSNLTYGMPHLSRIGRYLKTVKDKKKQRELLRTCRTIIQDVLEEAEAPETILANAEGAIFSICSDAAAAAESFPERIDGLADRSIEKTQKIARQEINVSGVPSGFADIDRMTGGYKETDLIILAARPAMGKTSMMAQTASSAASDSQKVVAIFSLEMSKEQLTARIICAEAQVDVFRYLNGYLIREEWGRVAEAREKISGWKLIIDDTPGLSTTQLLAKARRIKSEYKRLDFILVDYLQLMQSSKRKDDETAEITQISKELKSIAKQLNLPLIALSQLSRKCEERTDKRPLMSDLRQSGSIEQDADLVCFLFREEYYRQTEENTGLAEFIIAKHRNGATGTIKLAFLKEFTRFENLYGGVEHSSPAQSSSTPKRQTAFERELEADPRFQTSRNRER